MAIIAGVLAVIYGISRFKKTGDRSYEIVQKKAGKPVYTVRTTVAPDGKSRTVTQKGTNGQGKAVDNSMYWERVQ